VGCLGCSNGLSAVLSWCVVDKSPFTVATVEGHCWGVILGHLLAAGHTVVSRQLGSLLSQGSWAHCGLKAAGLTVVSRQLGSLLSQGSWAHC